jgi:hypothetical protein
MRTLHTIPVILLTLLALASMIGGAGGTRAGAPAFTDDFRLEQCRQLVPNGGNDYFSLHPGRTWRFEGEDEGELVELEVKVLERTRRIVFQLNGEVMRVTARVVREREWVDGELVEESRNYFARCIDTNDIYYLGENVDFYKDGEIIGHDGAWLAGVDGALPGLIMPATFLLGARYFQEIAPGIALDQAEHVEMGLEIETSAGVFQNCIRIVETTPLEPGAESIKIYAPGIGLIVDDELGLVEYEP